jgi:hypothetical protein
MARIPFMVPGNNAHTFKEFIEKVKKVVEGRGLTHREILGKNPRMETGEILGKIHAQREILGKKHTQRS